jgi:hypothetical protein
VAHSGALVKSLSSFHTLPKSPARKSVVGPSLQVYYRELRDVWRSAENTAPISHLRSLSSGRIHFQCPVVSADTDLDDPIVGIARA